LPLQADGGVEPVVKKGNIFFHVFRKLSFNFPPPSIFLMHSYICRGEESEDLMYA
jgi:hypothetical protein